MAHSETLNKPILRYLGSKWRIATQIISYFPEHKCYVEPFGGSAAVLLQKRASNKEVFNDLDSEVVNFFKVLREQPERLRSQLRLHPYSRESLAWAFHNQAEQCELTMAVRFFIRSWMSVGGEGNRYKTGFRRSFMPDNIPERNYARSIELIDSTVNRFQGVMIENLPAIEVMRAYDGADTLFYVDPPYLGTTRTGNAAYKHDLKAEQKHLELLQACLDLRGKVIISGYDSDLYSNHLDRWRRVAINSNTTGQVARKEVLWMNFNNPTLF